MLVNAFMTDGLPMLVSQPSGDLVGTVLAKELLNYMFFKFTRYFTGLAAGLASLYSLAVGLFGSVSALSAVTVYFAPDDSSVSSNDLGNPRVGVSGFFQRMNLVAFFLG